MADVWLANGDEYTAGNDWTFVFTLTRDGSAVNVTDATITSSIHHKDREVLADQSVTLTTAASGIVTLTVADTANSGFAAGEYTGDVKVVHSGGAVEHFGPYRFRVRKPLT